MQIKLQQTPGVQGMVLQSIMHQKSEKTGKVLIRSAVAVKSLSWRHLQKDYACYIDSYLNIITPADCPLIAIAGYPLIDIVGVLTNNFLAAVGVLSNNFSQLVSVLTNTQQLTMFFLPYF